MATSSLLIVILVLSSYASSISVPFPKNFLFGVSSSAYQFEGAWNIDGKGPSIWDNFTHRVPSPIKNNETGDVACDSYHRYKEDVALAAATGSNFYRFSIAWSRILPNGYAGQVNKKGIQYYKNLIKEILLKKMKPVVTLYHWDLPQKLFEDGVDWTNGSIVPVFVDYVRIAVQNFPEVDRWLTINEPRLICHWGYGLATLAPALKGDGTLEYECAYNVLRAHAAAYHMYKKEFPHYKAKMSIVVDVQWFEPQTNSAEDVEATERQKQFEFGIYLHPVLIGDWPNIVKDRISKRSKGQKIPSRLPHFTKKEIDFVKGTYDFLSINHFHTKLTANAKESPADVISFSSDLRVVNSLDPNWPVQGNGWGSVPLSARRVLDWLKSNYGNHEILITELSVSEINKGLNDTFRVDTYTKYICNILAAVHFDRVNVSGIAAWALLDNFGWRTGYDDRLGLYQIDFSDSALTRVPKASAHFWQSIANSKHLNCEEWP